MIKLKDKILSCRKKSGLSQEALAEQIGVSRQAISKWETGDAVPEIGKLLLLASVFGVTTDWLLTDNDPKEEKTDELRVEVPSGNTSWVESIPGVLGKLLRRYGWLFGVYTAISGLGMTIIGALARILPRRMFSSNLFNMGMENDMFGTGTLVFVDEFGNQTVNSFGGSASSFAANNPVTMMGTAIMTVGIVLVFIGIILAIVLKKRGNR